MDPNSLTTTAQVLTAAVITPASTPLWQTIALILFGWLLPKAEKALASKVTPAQVATGAADVDSIAKLAQAGLAVAGQPAYAALAGQVATISENVEASHANLQAATAAAAASPTPTPQQVQAVQAAVDTHQTQLNALAAVSSALTAVQAAAGK